MEDLTSQEQRALNLMVRAFQMARGETTQNQDPGGSSANSTTINQTTLNEMLMSASTPRGANVIRPPTSATTLSPQRSPAPIQVRSPGSRSAGNQEVPNFVSRPDSVRRTPSATPSSRTLRELRTITSPYGDTHRRQRRQEVRQERPCSRKFLCLPGGTENRSPTLVQKALLLEFELGEKTVITVSSASSQRLKSDIIRVYPRLLDQEFELLRATGNGYGKPLVKLAADMAIPPLNIINPLRPGIIYVRPLQPIVTLAELSSYDREGSEISGHNDRALASSPVADESSDISENPGMSTDIHNIESNGASAISEINSNLAADTTSAQNRLAAATENQSLDQINYQIEASPFVHENDEDFSTLDEFRTNLYESNSGTQEILAQRDEFLESTIGMYLKDANMNLKLKPFVKFLFEPARDLGGVTREYFHLCLSGIQTYKYNSRYSIFEGQDAHLLPNTDSALLRSGVFKAIGKIMAHSLLHTGVGAYGLARPFVEYLLTSDIDSQHPFVIEPNDIPDFDVRNCLTIIDEKWTSERTRLKTEDRNLLVEQAAIAGFNLELTFANRHFLKDIISVHSVIDSRRSQLEDIRKPFQDLGITKFLSNRPYLWDAAFPPQQNIPLTAQYVKNHIQYEGEDVERIQHIFEAIIDETERRPNGLQNLLLYWQGWPSLREDKLIVHVAEHSFFVHTCFNKIDIPISMQSEELKTAILTGIEIGGFGSI